MSLLLCVRRRPEPAQLETRQVRSGHENNCGDDDSVAVNVVVVAGLVFNRATD